MPINNERLETLVDERIPKATNIFHAIARAMNYYAVSEGHIDEDAYVPGKPIRHDDYHQGIKEFSELITDAQKWRAYEKPEEAWEEKGQDFHDSIIAYKVHLTGKLSQVKIPSYDTKIKEILPDLTEEVDAYVSQIEQLDSEELGKILDLAANFYRLLKNKEDELTQHGFHNEALELGKINFNLYLPLSPALESRIKEDRAEIHEVRASFIMDPTGKEAAGIIERHLTLESPIQDYNQGVMDSAIVFTTFIGKYTNLREGN